MRHRRAENDRRSDATPTPATCRVATTAPRAALALACAAQFMVVLDISVVNVALPSMQAALGFGPGSLQWVVNGYALTFAGLLLLGGRLADLYGRRTFVAALGLFTLASLAGGLATTPGLLVASCATAPCAPAWRSSPTRCSPWPWDGAWRPG